ncbi:MAG: chemotaxis protein CheD [Bacillota bacterium]|jgi:chemotaxis protein CheD
MDPAKNIQEIQVGIADYKTAREPARLITLGLGSCVGIGIYDPLLRIGGLLHIMLPDSSQFNNLTRPAKFADLGIPLMLKDLARQGASVRRLQAKLVGGAQMFSGLGDKMVLNIGQRNIEASRRLLIEMGIKILSEDLGGNKGRTMIVDISTGLVTVRTLGSQLKVI